MNTNTGTPVHCQHSTTNVCTTKGDINAKAACAKQAEEMAREIYGQTATISWAREDAIAYPNARAAFDGQNARYDAQADSNPYLAMLRAKRGA